eukprot:m51a1_g13278 hypothetical protein (104) ;mRNA; f:348-659
MDFTCLEMRDAGPGDECGSRPEELVRQASAAAHAAAVAFGGENALEMCWATCSAAAFEQVCRAAARAGPMARFTYLRLTRALVDDAYNYGVLRSFVWRMHSAA